MDKGASGRQYWIFNRGSITQKIRKLNDEAKRTSFFKRIEIKEQIRKLESEQYLDISAVTLQGHGLGFSVPREIPLYFYTQNGEAFEFFSGVKIGQVKVGEHSFNYDTPYIESPYAFNTSHIEGPYARCLVYLRYHSYFEAGTPLARELDAPSFASAVKPLLPKKKQIAAIVTSQFNRIISHKNQLLAADKAKQDALNKKNQDAEDFLNNYID